MIDITVTNHRYMLEILSQYCHPRVTSACRILMEVLPVL